MPLCFSPVSFHTLAHPDGELATAAAAATMGIGAFNSIEDAIIERSQIEGSIAKTGSGQLRDQNRAKRKERETEGRFFFCHRAWDLFLLNHRPGRCRGSGWQRQPVRRAVLPALRSEATRWTGPKNAFLGAMYV
jgi:hypothetical protein